MAWRHICNFANPVTFANLGNLHQFRKFQFHRAIVKSVKIIVNNADFWLIFSKAASESVRITHQPHSTVLEDGSGLLLECRASGFPYPRYQWYHENTELSGATSSVMKLLRFELI